MKTPTPQFHPEIKEWWLMNDFSPYVISGIYLLTLAFIRKVIILSSRNPDAHVDLANKLLRVLVYVNGIIHWTLLIFFIHMTFQLEYSWVCEPPTKPMKNQGTLRAWSQSLFGETPQENKRMELQVAKALWWYFLAKVFDFVDHVVLTLRNDEVTFLAVGHHIVMVIISWIGVKYAPGGSTVIWVILNCGYLAATYACHIIRHIFLGNNDERGRLIWRRSLRPWIFKFQKLQFILTMMHCFSVVLNNCGYPRLYSLGLLIFVMLLYMYN